MQITALLPLDAHGCPLLPVESAEGQQRFLQAMLHWAAADSASPEQPVADVLTTSHLHIYDDLAATGGWRPQRAALAEALHCMLTGVQGVPYTTSVDRQLSALRLLTEPDSARSVRRELAEVAAAAAASQHPPAIPLPSLEQLRYVCHRIVLRTAIVAKEASRPGSVSVPPTPQQAAALNAALATSSEALLALQPANPASWALAGAAAAAQHRTALCVKHQLRGAQLARQQRADAAFATCAVGAAMISLLDPTHMLPAHGVARLALTGVEALTPRLVERALALIPEIEPALKRATRLLPAYWVQNSQQCVQLVQQKLAARSGQREGSYSGRDTFVEFERRMDESRLILERQTLRAPHCAGCGLRAVGLRCCSRCQSAAYCRCVRGSDALLGCGGDWRSAERRSMPPAAHTAQD